MKEENKPTGLFISEDEKGHLVYSGPFDKGGYLISKSNYNNYRKYSGRFLFALIGGVLVNYIVDNGWLAIGAGIVFAIIGEILFRIKFINNCSYMNSYDKQAKSFVQAICNSSNKKERLLKFFLILAFAILIVLLAYNENYTGITFYACWLVGIGSLVLALIYLVAYFKK